MLANIYDEDGDDADRCEQEGFGEIQTLNIIDTDPEYFSGDFGSSNRGCFADDYVVSAEFTAGDTTKTFTREFRVAGGDGGSIQEVEEDD